MWIIISILNIVFAFFAEKNYANDRWLCKLFLCLMVVANVMVWGLRDIGVGIDTITYIDAYFLHANSMGNLKDVFSDVSGYDKGFVVISWIATMIGNDSRILIFLTELFVILFFVFGLYNFKKTLDCSITWIVVLFIILYQHETINLMRQFCAMSLLFWGYSKFLQKKYLAYILCQVVAYFFHSSSVVFIIVPIAQMLSQSKFKIKYLYFIFSVTLGLAFVFLYFALLPYMQSANLLNEVYFDRYGQGSSYSMADRDANVGIMQFIQWIALIIIIAFFYSRKNYLSQDLMYMLSYLVIMTFIFRLSSMFVMKYFFRISFYVGLIMIVYLSIIIRQKVMATRMLSIIYLISITYIIVRTISADYYGKPGIMPQRNTNHLIYKSQILDIDESR